MIDRVTKRVVTPGFHTRVYTVVRRIPYGKVSTYGRIATLLGSPRVARHVGWALAALPGTDTDVPWHRVINAQRRISFKGDLLRTAVQRELLEAEGVVFDTTERVDFSRFLWAPDAHVFRDSEEEWA